jgi:hypothetical protein
VGAGNLRKFFRKQHCHDSERVEERITAIGQAVSALQDRAVIEAQAAMVQSLARLIEVAMEGIRSFDKKIQQVTLAHPDYVIFESLPGAGDVMEPRLLAALGSQRERYAAATEVQTFNGIAPVREQSGRTVWIQYRSGCPKFQRQSWHEWAGHSIAESRWARAYYQQQRARGKSHHAAVRALAFKWIRIVFRCWKDRVPYKEETYMAALAKRNPQLYAQAMGIAV